MTSRLLQTCLASVFLLLGGWCLLLPGMVEALTLRPEFVTGSSAMKLVFACFGAQAVLTGTILLTARFSPLTFLIFGLVGSVPFFVFNAWFYFVTPILNGWMALDFIGNLVILGTGVWGYLLRRRELQNGLT